MESIKELYKIGNGPSSSHTMGPEKAAEIFLKKYPHATSYKVILYGSLGATGKGHLTDKIILSVLGENKTTIVFSPDIIYKYHTNGMMFKAYNNNQKIGEWLVFSVGGGTLKELNEPRETFKDSTYKETSMKEILTFCKENNLQLIDYIKTMEKEDIIPYLSNILTCMEEGVKRGLFTSGILPGGLNVERKAASFYNNYLKNPSLETLVYAASLAVSEENASGGKIVTAPTCGASGVVPGVLYAEKTINNRDEKKLIDALLIGGLIGNLVKTNGSISGAEVGCQGEVGVACAMASAMIAFLNGANNEEIEYAAEIGLEHHLGLTCDPVNGLVQIPCIERNAISAMQAYSCAHYAILTSGVHHISLDEVIEVMKQTGKDLREDYRETSKGGLARSYK